MAAQPIHSMHPHPEVRVVHIQAVALRGVRGVRGVQGVPWAVPYAAAWAALTFFLFPSRLAFSRPFY